MKPLGKKAAIDNNIFLWGFKESSSPGQEKNIKDAKDVINHLEKTGNRILIPAVVLAELLMPVPENLHSMTLNLISRSFEICPFDAKAAVLSAKLWQGLQSTEALALLKESGANKTKIKFDIQLVAIAITNEADYIVSEDSDIKKIAKGKIPVYSIAELQIEQTLFVEK